jgi:hypothetical protein
MGPRILSGVVREGDCTYHLARFGASSSSGDHPAPPMVSRHIPRFLFPKGIPKTIARTSQSADSKATCGLKGDTFTFQHDRFPARQNLSCPSSVSVCWFFSVQIFSCVVYRRKTHTRRSVLLDGGVGFANDGDNYVDNDEHHDREEGIVPYEGSGGGNFVHLARADRLRWGMGIRMKGSDEAPE